MSLSTIRIYSQCRSNLGTLPCGSPQNSHNFHFSGFSNSMPMETLAAHCQPAGSGSTQTILRFSLLLPEILLRDPSSETRTVFTHRDYITYQFIKRRYIYNIRSRVSVHLSVFVSSSYEYGSIEFMRHIATEKFRKRVDEFHTGSTIFHFFLLFFSFFFFPKRIGFDDFQKSYTLSRL